MSEQNIASNSYSVGASDTRPWGSWRVIDAGVGYAVKRITVDPGNILSLQRHQHRSEHWTVVQGHARVHVGDEVLDLGANEAVYIPVEALHRIQNVGEQSMVFIEVQCGAILDENDIERIEDDYGRT
ncbi:MAG: phosphomannose isomerase type II C-terminal cupin domain [Rhodospirillales bacterium]|nr:phosphomannose isomerase type II C-terminal cupin domain [Rhodospirillales bacterium]